MTVDDVRAPDLSSGDHLGAFRIERLLARGPGLGDVYLAEQGESGRRAALKVLAPTVTRMSQFHAMFERETTLAASLDHPHIPEILEAGEADGLLYLATRFVDGEDLGTALREEARPDPQRFLSVVAQTAGALDAAHAAGLVHRDVKPAKIVLAGSPERAEHAYLTGLGLPRPWLMGKTELARPGVFLGTIDYTAPELVQGRAATPASDIYALGCVAYEMVAGHGPFHGPPFQVLMAHVEDEPPDPAAGRTDLSQAFGRALLRALEKDPSNRPPTGAAYAQMLLHAAE